MPLRTLNKANRHITGCAHDKAHDAAALRRAMLKEFLKLLMPVAVLAALAVTYLHVESYRSDMEILRNNERMRIEMGMQAIRGDFAEITADLRYLAESSAMSAYLDNGDRNRLAREFLAFSRQQRSYDQIRVIDASGREAVRINYGDGRPTRVPDSQLQDKSGRYYFTETLALARDEVFISPLDLNIENGLIESPRKPMIRFGMPLFDANNEKRGILVLNYLGEHLLGHLRDALASPGSRPMLLNADGYWLLAGSPDDEWGFMFKNDRRFPNRHPEAWKTFLQKGRGETQDNGDLFTFATIFPVLEGQKDRADLYIPSPGQRDPRKYFWLVVSQQPDAVLSDMSGRHWRQGLLQFGLLLVFLFVGTTALSWAQVRERAANRLLSRLEQHMHDITHSLAVGLIVIDDRNRLTMMNPEAERLLGWREAELCGEDICTAIYPSAAGHGPAYQSGLAVQEDTEFVRKDGSRLPVSRVVSTLLVDGARTGTVISFQDISERKRLEQELQCLATHDELTGLFNRRELNARLDEEIRLAARYGQPFGLLMVDIDHFKRINDEHGHHVGDIVLRAVADTLRKTLRETDLAARFGGEEFTVVLPQTRLDAAERMAERLRAAIAAEPVPLDDGRHVALTVSIGVAASPEHGDKVDDLMKAADRALYAAKEAGRDCVRAPA